MHGGATPDAPGSAGLANFSPNVPSPVQGLAPLLKASSSHVGAQGRRGAQNGGTKQGREGLEGRGFGGKGNWREKGKKIKPFKVL